MKKQTKRSWIFTLGFIFGAIIIWWCYAKDSCKQTDIKINYGIDLREKGYLIHDTYDDEVYYVEYGELEDWFLKMNM